MSILQRTAQLIRDLKELQVLSEEDYIQFCYVGDNMYSLKIKSYKGYEQKEYAMKTIVKAIKQEFKDTERTLMGSCMYEIDCTLYQEE